MEQNNTFKVIDKEGKEIVCDVLFTFDSDETNKNYIVYTDNSKDDQGNTKVYASVYEVNEEKGTTDLLPVETEKEWTIIETIINSISEENKNNG